MNRGLVGEFETSEALLVAIQAMQAEGFQQLDAHLPYPVKNVIEALGFPRSRVPLYALCGGIIGGSYAYLIQWWMNGFDYALNVGGLPLGSAPAFIPPAFEGTVLLTSLGALVAFLGFSGLPKIWSPIMEVKGFERASVDRFFLTLDAKDPAWDPDRARDVLRSNGALAVSIFGLEARGERGEIAR